jgi:hypothetical protein
MTKVFAITLVAFSLAACGSMGTSSTMGNRAETKNSTDANKSGNTSAASPGAGMGGSTGAGSAAGTGTGASGGATR